jgi:23S rRNA (uracil1939-C5)-methyltransferase
MADTFKVQIQSMAYGGSGLARLPDGSAVFVPFTMPGEEVVIRIREKKRNYSLADLIDMVKPHAERVAASCVHFGFCGGCHYQHLPYRVQVKTKRQILIEQLQRLAGIPVVNIQHVVSSSDEWAYRNALQFHLNPSGALCFAAHADNRLFPVQECHLPMPAIDQIWRQCSFDDSGDLDRVEIRQNQDDDALILMTARSGVIPELEIGSTVSMVHQSPQGQVVIAGEDALVMQVLGQDFQVSAQSFFQVNLQVAAGMANLVKEWASHWKPDFVMDLYSGVGLFSAFLAPEVKRVIAVESSVSACRDYAVNLDAYDHIELYEGLAEQVLPGMGQTPDLIVADPPRSGIHKHVLHEIVRLAPKVLIYISCDPATLARDLLVLARYGYHLERSALIDMFPQTYHIESVNMIIKNGD